MRLFSSASLVIASLCAFAGCSTKQASETTVSSESSTINYEETFLGYVNKDTCPDKALEGGYTTFRIGADFLTVGREKLYSCYGRNVKTIKKRTETFLGYLEKEECETRSVNEGYQSFRVGEDKKKIGNSILFDCYGISVSIVPAN